MKGMTLIRKLNPSLALRAAMTLLAAGMAGLAGCGLTTHRLVDSNTSNAWKASESADALTSSAADCPGASKEIAAAKAAGDAAKAAGDALDAAGHALDEARDAHRKADKAHDKINGERSEKQRAADAARKAYKELDAPYIKAEEERQSALVQASLAGFDAAQTTDEKLDSVYEQMMAAAKSGAKRLGAAAQVPQALANAAAAKAKRDLLKEKNAAARDRLKELDKRADALYQPTVKAMAARDAAKVAMDKAQPAYDAAEDVAIAKTKESKAANAKLAEACPKARRGLETPSSKSRGLDIFNKTKDHHQEPAH